MKQFNITTGTLLLLMGIILGKEITSSDLSAFVNVL